MSDERPEMDAVDAEFGDEEDRVSSKSPLRFGTKPTARLISYTCDS